MNRQLIESGQLAQPLPAPVSTPDEIVIPTATARAIIERDCRNRTHNASRREEKPRAALEATPHVVNALTAMWGYHECSIYLRKLLVVDTQRGNRQGFTREAFDELVFLYRLIQDNRQSLVKEKMPKIQRDELKHRERLMRIESAYLRRS